MAQPYIGEIRMFGGNFAPVGWALCNGQLLPISENEALFQLIGTTYGGDGESTFALPDLQGRVPMHMGTGPTGESYLIGEMAGDEQVTLTTNQIPNHTHALIATTQNAIDALPEGKLLAQPEVNLYTPAGSALIMHNQLIEAVGGSQPHENMQEFLVINFIISLFGIFPTQT